MLSRRRFYNLFVVGGVMKNPNKARKKRAKKLSEEALSNVSGGNRGTSTGQQVREGFERLASDRDIDLIIDSLNRGRNR